MDEEPAAPSPSAKPSNIPSWAMLGFVLGVLFVLALPSRHPEPAPAPPTPPVQAPAPTAPPRLTTVEAVFAEWARYAVWDNDRTEVALWNPQTQDYSDCFEVVRSGAGYYFRSISRLTRPVLTHGVRSDSPMRFTETEDQRQEWLGQRRQEDWQAIGEAMRPDSTPKK